MMLVAVWLVLGTAASLGLARFLASVLFEVGRYDPRTLAAVAGVLALSALAACLVPARGRIIGGWTRIKMENT